MRNFIWWIIICPVVNDGFTSMNGYTRLTKAPGGEFGVAIDRRGSAELFCCYWRGNEVQVRATHGPLRVLIGSPAMRNYFDGMRFPEKQIQFVPRNRRHINIQLIIGNYSLLNIILMEEQKLEFTYSLHLETNSRKKSTVSITCVRWSTQSGTMQSRSIFTEKKNRQHAINMHCF